jgi:hypothetical protein
MKAFELFLTILTILGFSLILLSFILCSQLVCNIGLFCIVVAIFLALNYKYSHQH